MKPIPATATLIIVISLLRNQQDSEIGQSDLNVHAKHLAIEKYYSEAYRLYRDGYATHAYFKMSSNTATALTGEPLPRRNFRGKAI
jgi:hypothetical protein